ncbi:tRNA/rRNA methyltransferase [Paraglaciecola hydrolytica]|uniref:tRNA/rRNA methyltransferase n=1 Tax=Paraglaciecola hydrolytica TaxID=1799789 RepID=UPI0009EB47DF|nr:tRNA/rRNA methyltransferase [Paraglaciecola hydrolytica]
MSKEANSRRSPGKPSSNTAGGPRKPSQPRHTQGSSGNAAQKPWVKEGDKTARQNNKKTLTSKVSAATLRQHRLEEAKVQGENACRVCFNKRPQSVVKMYVEVNMAKKFADVMKYLAANKYAYHIVENAELEKVAGSEHHGGVVLIVKRKPELTLAAYLAANKDLKQDCLLALDGVGNPHNLGAIARSCAHFGVKGVMMTQPYLLQSGAAARTAEGGIEFVDGLSCDNLPLALQQCKQAGYSLVTTSSHASVSLYQSKLANKVVVVFGEEMDGVSPQVAKSTDVALQIPGSGQVESLNVSVAASLILGEWYRQQRC